MSIQPKRVLGLAPTFVKKPLQITLPTLSLRSLVGAILPVSALLLLEVLVRSGYIAPNLLPAPTDIFLTLKEMHDNGLAEHVVASSARVGVGFSAGTVLAVLCGVLVGLSRHVEAVLDPTFQALRAIPSLAWVPLLLLWFGIDESPKIILIAIGAFFPVYLGVVSGIRNVDRKLIEVGKVYGFTGATLIRRVFLPASLPALFTGLRNGLSLAWMFMVAAELIAATKGLGYLLTDGRETSRPDIVLAAILLLAVLGKLSDTLLKSLEHRQLRWRDSFMAQQNF